MKKVVICDDEEIFIENIKKVLAKYAIERKEKFDIKSYTSYKTLMFDADDLKQIDVLFIDIEFDVKNGIDIVKDIQETNCHCQVIYITAHSEYVFRSFETRVCDFLIKPFTDERIISAFTKALGVQNSHRSIEVLNNKTYQKIYVNEIVYISSDKRKIKFYCCDRKKESHCIEIYGKLDEYQKALEDEDCFVRIRQSILVNLKFVDFYDGNNVRLYNGEHLSISRNYKQEVRYKYLTNRINN